MFLSGNAPPMPPFPTLIDGLLSRDDDGNVSQGAGLLGPHTEIERANFKGRLDEYAGDGFLIVSRADPERFLDENARHAMKCVGAKYLSLGDRNSTHFAEDLSGRYAEFLSREGWSAMIVRPDYYVYGGAGRDTDLQNLATQLVRDMQASGFRFSVLRSGY
jgi:hypothetical protein